MIVFLPLQKTNKILVFINFISKFLKVSSFLNCEGPDQTDTCLTAGSGQSGVESSIPARSDTFAKIEHEIFSTAILLPSADSRRVVVSYKRKYVHKSTG